jgi:hypothetical protein
MTSLDPGTETPPKHNLQGRRTLHKAEQKQHQTAQELTSNNTAQRHKIQVVHLINPTRGSHRSDQSGAPVRPVVPGQLGMNRARGSTPPNPTPDLPIRSMDSYKTLGI